MIGYLLLIAAFAIALLGFFYLGQLLRVIFGKLVFSSTGVALFHFVAIPTLLVAAFVVGRYAWAVVA